MSYPNQISGACAAGYLLPSNTLHLDAYERRSSVCPQGVATRGECMRGNAALANMFALQAIPCLVFIQATGSARINTRVH